MSLCDSSSYTYRFIGLYDSQTGVIMKLKNALPRQN